MNKNGVEIEHWSTKIAADNQLSDKARFAMQININQSSIHFHYFKNDPGYELHEDICVAKFILKPKH